MDVLYADALDEVEGFGECSDVDEIRRSGLELERQVGEGGAFKAYMFYHFASALVRRHLFKQFLAAVEHTYAGRAVHLVG